MLKNELTDLTETTFSDFWSELMTLRNPYLTEGRLADVIAAITALANYRYYKISFEKAAEKITNIPEDAKKWEIVLKEHPEFFRISGNTVSLSIVSAYWTDLSLG